MAVMTYRDAINLTMHQEMERDPNIILIGEDVAGGMGTEGGPEAIGSVWGTSVGLYDKFGPSRIIDTPISESAIVGAAAGAAIARRLTESKTSIPHFYLRARVAADRLMALRKRVNAERGSALSINDFLVRAAALALSEVPDVNIQVHGDEIHRFGRADIALRNIIENADGLV